MWGRTLLLNFDISTKRRKHFSFWMNFQICSARSFSIVFQHGRQDLTRRARSRFSVTLNLAQPICPSTDSVTATTIKSQSSSSLGLRPFSRHSRPDFVLKFSPKISPIAYELTLSNPLSVCHGRASTPRIFEIVLATYDDDDC